VVVVGGGPAGCTTAEVVASKGYRVLILEKKRCIGHPVRCGEFIPETEELKRMLPSARNLDDVFDIPKDLKARSIDEIILVSPRGKEFRFDFSGYSTWRERFDLYLAEKARRAGAEISTGSFVVENMFSGGRSRGVKLSTGRVIEGRVIVGADGPHSIIARGAGLPRQNLVPAVTSRIPGEFGSSVRMFFGSIAPGGYAWIIPKDGCANIGLGAQIKRLKGRQLTRILHEFLVSQGITGELPQISGKFIPINGPRKVTVSGNVILVGDSAGHVMPTNGGGIPIAMICGSIAGGVISDCLEGKCKLQRYETAWRKQVGRELETAKRVKRIADTLAFRSDSLLEFWMRTLGVKRLQRVIKCRTPFG